MRRRIYLAAIVLLSFASVSVATFVAIQKTKPTTKAGQKSSEKTTQGARTKGGAQSKNAAPATPIRPVDPNRAPQSSVDDALFTNEDFFGTSASVARPYGVALERIGSLETQYPKDARLRLHSARLAEHLGQFDKAAAEMNQYAALKRRSP